MGGFSRTGISGFGKKWRFSEGAVGNVGLRRREEDFMDKKMEKMGFLWGKITEKTGFCGGKDGRNRI